jgi:hypothetical protein
MWQQDSTYYPGKCVGYDSASGKHTIEYEEGSTEVLRLRREGDRASSASAIWRLREKRCNDGRGREGAELLEDANWTFDETQVTAQGVHDRKNSKHRRVRWAKNDGNWPAQIHPKKKKETEEEEEEQEEYEEEEEEVTVSEVQSWSGMYPSVVVALGFRLQASTPRGSEAELRVGGDEGRGAQLIRGQTSKYRGVCLNKSTSKWQAQIHYAGKQHSLGSFDDEEVAARAYDRAARAHCGDKATLNFPAEGEQGVDNGKRSKYRGVSRGKSSSKWQAYIKHTGKNHCLGSFDDEQDAARAYNRAARTHHGDKAVLNFLVEGDDEDDEEDNTEGVAAVVKAAAAAASGMYPSVVVALSFRLQVHTPRGTGGEVEAKSAGGGSLREGKGPKLGSGKSSKYRGVYWNKSSSNWRAIIGHTGKQHYLGCFDNEEEAARAYDRAARAHHADKAILNFPAEGEQGVRMPLLDGKRSTHLGGEQEQEQEQEGEQEEGTESSSVPVSSRSAEGGTKPSQVVMVRDSVRPVQRVDMPTLSQTRSHQYFLQQQQQQPQMPGVPMRLPKAPCPKRLWSEDEDKSLCDTVRTFGPRKWKRIAENVPGRNHIQCIQRWKTTLDPGLRKGQWTKEEDSTLRGAKQSDPTRSWAQVATSVAGRSGKQCRERWYTVLDPCIKVSPNTCSCECAYACESASGRKSDKARTRSYSHLRSTHVFHLLLATRAPTHVPVYDIRPPANCVDWGGGCHAAEDVGTVR